MAEPKQTQYPWPKNSWAILTKIIRAWYAAEAGSGEVTQKKIADMAGVQQSQVSTNKAFLQAIGILTPEGLSLTMAGQRVGIGLYNSNEGMRQEGLQLIVSGNTLLTDMLDIIKGRDGLKLKTFSDEIALRTKGNDAPGFATGVFILQEILVNSGLTEISGDTIRPTKARSQGGGGFSVDAVLVEKPMQEKPANSGLKRIPIAVSTSTIWWIEVGDNPADGEIEKFLEMQKLMFAK